MKQSLHRLLTAALIAVITLCSATMQAQERRPIDPRHPMWMIHIDVWNNADPQKIIDLIPDDIKPYVCMNLSLSCSFDKTLGVHTKPQNAIQTYRSWASICCLNNMWFTCQPASGGHTHIKDNDLETFESFFKDYKNFLGWNYAEQFWGFNEGYDASKGETANNSSSDTERIALFAKLVPMHHQYGGFLTISFCGNIWSHPLNPVGMMKRNSSFLNACKANPEAILFLYKYTTSANWFNNESVTLAPFISGLAKNYGVRYDNCGWNGAVGDALMKDDGKNHTYPGAVGVAPVLEQMALNGACVWDGPELIWTEDFKEVNRVQTGGFTSRKWETYPNFDNIWVDMFRKVLDGTIHIATREEVVQRTKICIKNDISAGSDQTGLKIEAYAAPIDLYHGLYLQENDPFNQQSSYESDYGNIKGYGNNNFLYFKKTGRYQAIPVVIDLYDSLAKTIPYVVKRSAIKNKTKWSTRTAKVRDFDKYYPEVSKGDLFVARHYNELVCYFPYSYSHKKKWAKALVPLEYNTCDSLRLGFGKFDAAIMHEYADRLVFYFNNYRADTTTQRVDTITIYGATARPTYTYKRRAKASGSFTETWDETTGEYSLMLKHNGPYDVTIECAGAATERKTDYVDVTPITEVPAQPETYYGELTFEAEDLDYKDIATCVTDQYNHNFGQYRSMRGHSAMGFMVMGTNSTGALHGTAQINMAGDYLMSVRYLSTVANGVLSLRANSTKSTKVPLDQCATNEWRTATLNVSLKEGSNGFYVINTGAKDVIVDNVTFTPLFDPYVSVEGVKSDVPTITGAAATYDIQGRKVNSCLPGHLYIMRQADGTTVKRIVK